MEAVHKPSHRTWISDTVISVKKFLEEWSTALPFNAQSFSSYHTLTSLLNEKEYVSIAKEHGKEVLRCHYQEKVELATSLHIPNGVCLDTLRYQSEDLQERADDSRYASAIYHSLKCCNFPPNKILTKVNKERSNPPSDPPPEVVLTVVAFLPERRVNSTMQLHFRLPAFQFDQEFLVLGSTCLAELRDKIDCVSDRAVPGDFSDNPTFEPTFTCKDIYKSGFFYINGVFYNDMRNKDCRDYSEKIIKWAENKGRDIGPFKKAKMEETQFRDLDIQLGYPYLYTHQGDCEHLLVFTDLKMLSRFDAPESCYYPMYSQVKPSKRIFCMVCQTYTASWVVFDNKRLPENPYFFCKICFFKFHYDENNQKIGEFKAYHYPDRTKMA